MLKKIIDLRFVVVAVVADLVICYLERKNLCFSSCAINKEDTEVKFKVNSFAFNKKE